jgi:hypothetical protein
VRLPTPLPTPVLRAEPHGTTWLYRPIDGMAAVPAKPRCPGGDHLGELKAIARGSRP